MSHSEKSITLRTLIIAPLALLAFPGCQMADENREPDVVITRITAEDTKALDAPIVVSTQNQGEALMFDPAQGAIAYDQIDLVCPNGQQMGMVDWLAQFDVTQELDVNALLSQEFTLASSRSDAAAALIKPAPEEPKLDGTGANLRPPDDGCCYQVCVAEECYLCPDGVWICTCTQWQTVCNGGDPYCEVPIAE